MSETARTQAAASVGPWSKLYELKIEFADDGVPNAGKIYKNGYQQIGVLLTAKPTDDQGNPLTESNSPGITALVRRALGLVDYKDASRLQFVQAGNTGAHWCYTDTANGFTTGSSMNTFLFSTGSVDDADSDVLQFSFYVMCPPAEHAATIAIAAQADVPNPDGGGTYSVTTRGVEPNDFPKNTLSIAAVPPVRYTDLNTDLASFQAYQDPDNSETQKIVARNHVFACREPGHEFIRFDIAPASVGEYWHVFDESTAYQNPGEAFKRYRKFNIAYAWSKSSPAQQQVFGLKDQPGSASHWWPVQVNQDDNSFYFTVAEYDTTLGGGRGFGYPGSPVNVSSPASGGKSNVYFTVWDQFGNSGDFTPETEGLLDDFKVKPGRS
ncbi:MULTISPECIES: hypothetical protein [unclassified Pseudomonas]|uniref:hypothetical protein n=1 Tax=unclassified Pseudomonas TaxID=196821 RepID=UPI000BA3F5D1|nr:MULTISPECIES: hypothetical protein [unclassified Pseudomonas]MCU1735027.1 hypothetical protein [Pseudomonas sp. 20P_3.2_Bac4]MCU1743502.1 hypothetical protein [Pseudomonas sp. 20P_3.2_Bac5]